MKNFLLFFLSLHVYAVDEELLNAIDQNYAFKEKIVFSNNIEQFSSGYLIRSENEVQIQINEPFKESYTYKDGYIQYIDYDLPSESFFDVKDLNNPIIDLFLMKVQKKALNIIKINNYYELASDDLKIRIKLNSYGFDKISYMDNFDNYHSISFFPQWYY